MDPVLTGKYFSTSNNTEYAINRLTDRIKQVRFLTEIDRMAVAGIAGVLDDAMIHFPVGNSDISLILGVDDCIENIKDDYFNNILNDGLLGASPLLFPFTSPNVLSAQICIAFDIRGESLTIPIKTSNKDVVEYAIECLNGKYSRIIIAGCIMLNTKKISLEEGDYKAEFFIIEGSESASDRGVRIYSHLRNKSDEF